MHIAWFWLPMMAVSAEIVGTYKGCVQLKSASQEATFETWKNFTQFDTSLCDNHEFCTGSGFYFRDDRCFTPFAGCALELKSKATLIMQTPVTQLKAPGTIIEKGRYIVLFGPASTLGVGSKVSYGELIERELGVPVLNLGRGGMGPHDYLTALPFLKPLLANAAAVIVMVMAGRSSENSLCHYGSCTTLERTAIYEQMLRKDKAHAKVLLEESLSLARQEYDWLFSNITTQSDSPPRILGLWFSQRPMDEDRTGSYELWFPQFYSNPSTVYELKKVFNKHNSTLVDGAYGDIPAGDDLEINYCTECPSLERDDHRTCSIVEVRHEVTARPSVLELARMKLHCGENLGKCGSDAPKSKYPPNGCTFTCDKVDAGNYYGNANAHQRSADRLLPHLRDLF